MFVFACLLYRNKQFPADIWDSTPSTQAKRCINVLFILLAMSLCNCESSLGIFYCLSVLYAACIVSPISFHTKTKKRRAPWFHKPILRELHWTLSIVISTFVFVWANECGSMVCCWLFTRKSNIKNVWIRISPRLTLENDSPYKVCSKWLLKSITQIIVLI